MSKKDQRDKKSQRPMIIRRRILLLVFLLILIPILYKGTSLLVDGSKSLSSNSIDKETEIESPKEPSKEPSKDDTPIKDKDEPKEPEVANVKILSVGDVMFHMPQIKSAYTGDGNYNFNESFKYVKEQISDADIAIANFETVTLGNDKSFSGFPQFNSPKETLLGLKEAGFDILSTANNHSLDQGKDGILKTLEYIEEYGLKSAGTYKEKQTEFLIEEKNGVKLGFLAYTYGLNGLDFYLSPEELDTMINLIDEEKIKSDIEAIKKDVDVVVVSVHWGIEYQRAPNSIQTELGHKMVDWGANIVLGSHPHVLQRSEIVEKDGKDNFIVYSMGNFISNQRQDTMGNSFTEDGIMIEIDIEKDIKNNSTTVKAVNFFPTWIDKYKADGKDNYRILPTKDVIDGKIDIELSDAIKNRIQKSHNDSMETLKFE